MPLVLLLALTRAEYAARFGIAAAVAVGAWLVLLGLLAVATRARTPDAGPGALELPGAEPPAVVAMLTDGWEVGREAVPATLIDLAARKVLAIEGVGPDRFVVRLRPASATPPDLTPYEDQVLDHVRRLASADGTVPCEALTTGPEDESKGWWGRFERAVVKDSRDRGLSRGRWSKWMLGLLGAVALVPAVLAALAVATAPQDDTEDENPIGVFLGVTAMGWFGLMAVPGKLRAERDTPAGREAAARWLGLRDHLEGSGGFTDAPPAAVAIWDRYLSYGAALGVAAGAVRALPLGSESDKLAWTSYGGHWRTVKIDYPRRFPPGWGKPPLLASAIGLGGLLAGLFVARIFFPLMADAAADLFNSTEEQGFDPVNLIAIGILAIPTVVTALLLLRSVLMLRAAVPDLFVSREVEGVVLRIRRQPEKWPHLAVFDGHSTRVRAWLVAPAVLANAGLRQGARVSGTVTPHLGHVSRLEVSAAEPAPS